MAPGDGGGEDGAAEPIEPGTPESPRTIQLEATATVQFVDADGNQVSSLALVPGETVTFEVTNTAGFDHNFYIGTEEELMVPGATTEVGIPTWTEGTEALTWTVEEGESLQFACTVPGHYQTMHGDLVFQEGGEAAADGDAGDAGEPGQAPGEGSEQDAGVSPAEGDQASVADGGGASTEGT